MIVHKALTVAAVALSVAALSASRASADVVYSQNFDDGTVPASITSSSSTNLSIQTVADTTGSQALDLNQSGGSGSVFITAVLPSSSAAKPVVLNDGDSVSMSFDLHITGTPTPTVGDRKFRFGIYNSTSATTGTSGTNNNVEGYAARMDVGADVANTVADLWASVAPLGVTTAQGAKQLSTLDGTGGATSTDTAFQLTADSVRTITLTLTRSGNSIHENLTQVMGGVSTSLDGADNSSNVLSNAAFSFDQIMIGQNGGGPLDYRIDNLNVIYSAAAVPEPASLGLLGLGGLALLRRRRIA